MSMLKIYFQEIFRTLIKSNIYNSNQIYSIFFSPKSIKVTFRRISPPLSTFLLVELSVWTFPSFIVTSNKWNYPPPPNTITQPSALNIRVLWLPERLELHSSIHVTFGTTNVILVVKFVKCSVIYDVTMQMYPSFEVTVLLLTFLMT